MYVVGNIYIRIHVCIEKYIYVHMYVHIYIDCAIAIWKWPAHLETIIKKGVDSGNWYA